MNLQECYAPGFTTQSMTDHSRTKKHDLGFVLVGTLPDATKHDIYTKGLRVWTRHESARVAGIQLKAAARRAAGSTAASVEPLTMYQHAPGKAHSWLTPP
jgi:hypothetical protein